MSISSLLHRPRTASDIRQMGDGLRAEMRDWAARRQQHRQRVLADERLTPEAQAQDIRAYRDKLPGYLASSARQAWIRAHEARRPVAARLAGARALADSTFDYGKLNFLQAEYAARLGATVGQARQGKNVGHVAATIEQLRAEAHGDRHRLRALRVAAGAPLAEAQTWLASGGTAGSQNVMGKGDAGRLTAIAEGFKADERQEAPALAASLDELADIDAAIAELRKEAVMVLEAISAPGEYPAPSVETAFMDPADVPTPARWADVFEPVGEVAPIGGAAGGSHG